MAFDFKKEYRMFYLPTMQPEILEVPRMNFVAVRGEGDPNTPGGAYQRALGVLYAVSYALKMSKMTDYRIEGYFDYVVPPLESFWRQPGTQRIDYARKADFRWIACIRLPDFVSAEDFHWAVSKAERKKKLDCATAEFMTIEEGLCVQIMHLGPYDEEPASVAAMEKHIRDCGYVTDFSNVRQHHEIYLSDPRRTAAEKLKTVIRHPIRRS